jgi:hypothetical protein
MPDSGYPLLEGIICEGRPEEVINSITRIWEDADL